MNRESFRAVQSEPARQGGDPAGARGVRSVSLDPNAPVSCAALAALAEGALVDLSAGAWAVLREAEGRVAACQAEGRRVYGLTTGFGPLANRAVSSSENGRLQAGLIAHLAAGVGAPFSPREARAIAAARLIALCQNGSGASVGLAQALIDFLNAGLAPVIPQQGTVGASGDLTPLAHLALALKGEGEAFDSKGRRGPARDILQAAELAPFIFARRDGLALVNGVSAMTALAALNAGAAARLEAWAIALSAVHAELFSAWAEAWAPAFGQARPHPGLIAVSAALNARLAGSQRVRRTRLAEMRLTAAEAESAADQPQDPYTLRCAPQLLGAVREARAFHDAIAERELNASSDNPTFTETSPYALHGGNFFGQHVAFASDALSAAVIQTANLMERQLARLTDEKRGPGLPPFLTGGAPGYDSGLMGAQVTATALVAEMRATGAGISYQSLSTNGENQDIVPLGTIAARYARDHLHTAFLLAAINALACAQAVDLFERRGEGGFSPAARGVRDQVRAVSAFLDTDRPLSGEIEALAQGMARTDPPGADA